MGLRGPFRIAGHFFMRRHARHMGRRGQSVRPLGRPPGPGKPGRLRGGPVVRTFGEGGRRKRACALDGRGMSQRRLPRADVPQAAAAWSPRVQGRRSPACWRGPWGLRPRPGLPRPGKRPKQPFFPNLCPSCARADPPLPPPARARIVLPRAAPQPMRPREPREPDTAEDAGGQTDHSGQAFQGGLEGRGDSPPSPRLS